MKIYKIVIFVACIYLALVGYRVIAYNDSVVELETWAIRNKKKVMVLPDKLSDSDDNAPTKRGLTCRLEHVSGKTLNNKGEALEFDMKVPCTACNQYIYKSDRKCITYEYDKELNERDNEEPIMGTCTPSKDAIAQNCPFKTETKTFRDVYESLPINLIKSMLPDGDPIEY
jgi:hypothetical protein